jgi:hypothetical protein
MEEKRLGRGRKGQKARSSKGEIASRSEGNEGAEASGGRGGDDLCQLVGNVIANRRQLARCGFEHVVVVPVSAKVISSNIVVRSRIAYLHQLCGL